MKQNSNQQGRQPTTKAGLGKVKEDSKESEVSFQRIHLPQPPGTSLKVFSWAGVNQSWPWETGQGAGAKVPPPTPYLLALAVLLRASEKTQLEPQGCLFQEARHFLKPPIIGEVPDILQARTTLQKHEPGQQSEDNRVHASSPSQSQVRNLVLCVGSNHLTPWGFLLLGILVITQALNAWWINERSLFLPTGSGYPS